MKISLINHVFKQFDLWVQAIFFASQGWKKLPGISLEANIFQIKFTNWYKHCTHDHQILNVSQGLKICIMGIFYDNLRCPAQVWVGGNR